MARHWQHGDPTRMVAVCDSRQAEQLVAFDHHRVIVDDRWGILITYHWMSIEAAPEPQMAVVVFNPAPERMASEAQVRTIIRKHPAAPPDVQAIIGQLTFRIPDS